MRQTQEQIDNCWKLVNYLLSDKLQARFNMGVYAEIDQRSDYAIAVESKNCGSVGCAIGHGPYAGIPKRREDWGDYANRVFGFSHSWWTYAFDSRWEKVDNTPEGAALRIKYLLEKGLPNNWYEQVTGRAELTYKQ